MAVNLSAEFWNIVSKNEGIWVEKNGIVTISFPDGSKWDFTVPIRIAEADEKSA